MKRNNNKETITVLMILILAMFQLASAAAPAATNYSNQVHSNHVGPGTAGLDCAACHGSPPTYNNLDKMCINCHPTATEIQVVEVIGMSTPVATPDVKTPVCITTVCIQVHNNHVGQGSAGRLECAVCHGSPPKTTNIWTICINCHPAQTPAPTATAIPAGTYIPPSAPTATAIQVVEVIGLATPTATAIPVSTYIRQPAPTAIIISSPKVTPLQEQAPKLPVFLRVDKKAHLNVKYDLGKGRTDGEVLVSVSLNNTGNATATNVILSIEHPAGIAITSISGSDIKGNTITWSGDIIPGASHLTRYYARGVNVNLASIEIPLRVEYEKTSRAEKTEALAPYAASAPQAYAQAISERDIEIINLTMRLALVLIPGFEGILAIFAMIGVLGMNKRHRGG